MKYLPLLLFIFLVSVLEGCKSGNGKGSLGNFSEHKLSSWNNKLTDIIITDLFTPPVCSRIYAYCNIAAYEALVSSDTVYKSFAHKLNGLEDVPLPEIKIESNFYPVSGIIAFTTVAQKLLFNSDAMKDLEAEYLKELDKLTINEEEKNKAIAYGKKVGQHIVDWAAKDGYQQRNALPGYLVIANPESWQPTPPEYLDPVEPNWGSLRSFTMDSSSLFRPLMSLKFDTMSASDYYREAMIVYDAVNKLSSHDTLIARYWDCNPNVSITSGHVTYFQQQISPGGHWMFIAASVADKENLSMLQTAEVLSKVGVAIADAFISCWEAKYIYKTVRPETYINRYIDRDWRPFIQTPPFPEYPSGHSTISASASTMLTSIFGENYKFTDSAEVPFGRQAREFTSFAEAAQEASISRLLGGIHYLKSLNESAGEGKKIGAFVVKKMSSNSGDSLPVKISLRN